MAARPGARFGAGIGPCGLLSSESATPQWAMRAVRVGLRDLLENLLGGAVPERMLIAHRAIEAPLRDLIAGDGEMDVAELLISLALRGEVRWSEQRQRGDAGGDWKLPHDGSALFLNGQDLPPRAVLVGKTGASVTAVRIST